MVKKTVIKKRPIPGQDTRKDFLDLVQNYTKAAQELFKAFERYNPKNPDTNEILLKYEEYKKLMDLLESEEKKTPSGAQSDFLKNVLFEARAMDKKMQNMIRKAMDVEAENQVGLVQKILKETGNL